MWRNRGTVRNVSAGLSHSTEDVSEDGAESPRRFECNTAQIKCSVTAVPARQICVSYVPSFPKPFLLLFLFHVLSVSFLVRAVAVLVCRDDYDTGPVTELRSCIEPVSVTADSHSVSSTEP